MESNIQSEGIESRLCEMNVISSKGGRSENQDRCGMSETDKGFLVVVCDGMGGAQGGATASRTAVEEIIRFVNEPKPEDDIEDDPQLLLRKAILSANKLLMDISAREPSLAGMGTTVTAILLSEDKAVLAHVGDSRIYHIRNGKKIFRTFDHSMVFEMVKKKILTEEQARLSAQSNIILRALGQKADLEVDTCERCYDKGDIFFMCTDGIWGTMPEKELIKKIAMEQHPKVVTETLATEVDAMSRMNGGDNLTAAMLVTKNDSINRSKMETKLKKMLYACAIVLVISLILNALLFWVFNKADNQKCKGGIQNKVYMLKSDSKESVPCQLVPDSCFEKADTVFFTIKK